MEKYVKQLIADLKTAADKEIKTTYYEVPPHLKEMLHIAELAQVEFKPLSEWTGIDIEAFPEVISLNGNQIKRINSAIWEVLNSLNVEIVDLPENLPEELIYEIISCNWDYPIQYLPLSGFDLELCSGDSQTCVYGKYCECSNYLLVYKIPDKISDSIKIVAQMIEDGKFCSMNKETGEIKEIATENIFTTEVVFPKPELIHYKPINKKDELSFIKFFAEKEEDDNIREVYEIILEQENVFEKFKDYINKMSLNEEWETFRKNMPEIMVRSKYLEYCEDESNGLFDLNGIFDDDGNKIDVDSIKIPSMCMGCKSFYTEDAEENLLCMMNRSDQNNESEFLCGVYQNI